ncbi:hypothetical protein SAMN04488688_112174 [Paenibacillus sp. cl141a]|nr:hypothetical protein SAMN04488688_112174 [Paenibacillus sp. cl141a]
MLETLHIMHENSLIIMHLLEASHSHGILRTKPVLIGDSKKTTAIFMAVV